jgi:hypothetical protein
MGARAHTPTSSASTAPVKRFALGPPGRAIRVTERPPLALDHNEWALDHNEWSGASPEDHIVNNLGGA